ncbi:hypothetical protein LOZ12_005615 [Ophidiomyces ophidiicola]|uniref:Uncharacterized protein n=1 Tax=Ophidiomyces ophidiicola TaxID=1387563 RepID=A0ACB8V2K9_9EURO|nr:hypothetical protein LOZ64_001734 [Ophidiomyces ophidiicola]KAI1935063.1 hypothetical protein LOZ62_006104 [Ophidiomyces ophidiicola]KAI1966473.1 hypothetical protein LOZ56_005682 [Ophidiomyces ophidiicola]KAI1999040.1 hypothetical protein LOZ50_006634 [Ophidiomyces ophidiicola]KAI2005430.1 hypothetical protein LOZ49_005415 [Ophidiomyces ophidiicola]
MANLPDIDACTLLNMNEYNPVVDVSTDWGLPYMFFFDYIPGALDKPKQAMFDDQKAIMRKWTAWELALVERQVDLALAAGKLPSDLSFKSTIERVQFRTKVINVLRSTAEPWLRCVKDTPESETMIVKTVDVLKTIRATLQKRYSIVSKNYVACLTTVSQIIAEHPGLNNTFYHTQDFVLLPDGKSEDEQVAKGRVLALFYNVSPEALDHENSKIEFRYFDKYYEFDQQKWAEFARTIPVRLIERGSLIRVVQALVVQEDL